MDSQNYDVHEYRQGFTRKPIASISEIPLTIMLNGREVVTLLCTAKYPEYLAVGFLKSDAFITSPDQITDLTVRRDDQRLVAEVETCHDPWENRIMERSITSGCGKGTNFGRNVQTVSKRRLGGDIRITPDQILALVRELHSRSTLYNETRGCHNSSLCTPDEMLLFREDIGRHNAIDMLCGQCFLDNVPVDDKLIVSTGRVASEILLKVVRIGVPILVSTAVATNFSVELARKTGITLVGNAKDDSFWVYNDNGRIIGF
ncbi:MAG: formate dehydrogenase accessory sulfurtransferase FdhD [Pseudodesulfovibrio sp.]|uniref:Sulfur carrier protein FdhD n=1 Tax=Pseudodesulfovibrio aespoeensis (strain ATCC 700646 / DSM 10631 / Aspo-2) TaxID=643562 RepID=E6VV42_PSEA9|nr:MULTISPECIES: formate dehydrogenase accessory sulfurtransferase FdhD [Pseudodesulfovibrio]MBU4191461.1 formate dehydrogenase accessory sulfurtransferase FdhD [Pseudomonadota bacterium]ADU61193.1 formate dehydrogenase family accessory protein FdhD [Pseudodesulfovibrio aespoeensis Aspo-2]MBU4245276.1 formate dehydrogenase accessory sulfurtransferase FdhD [Pseudomonadota bacterium]MBU4379393.1 formate dehydrogenase accessory sulfurtransferase FdhD [Pseudomonadota bacterium]MBU4476644.1 formate